MPPFHWALPLATAGAGLEPLVVPPLTTPDSELRLTLDASGGLDGLTPSRIDVTVRGDLATALKLGLAALTPKVAEQKLRERWEKTVPGGEMKTITFNFDQTTGEERIALVGAVPPAWPHDPDTGVRGYLVETAGLGWRPDFTRKSKIKTDAPYAVPFPNFERQTTTVILNGETDDPAATRLSDQIKRTVLPAGG